MPVWKKTDCSLLYISSQTNSRWNRKEFKLFELPAEGRSTLFCSNLYNFAREQNKIRNSLRQLKYFGISKIWTLVLDWMV